MGAGTQKRWAQKQKGWATEAGNRGGGATERAGYSGMPSRGSGQGSGKEMEAGDRDDTASGYRGSGVRRGGQKGVGTEGVGNRGNR